MQRPGMVGGHLMRRKGQSLEFREYREYRPGDDIRWVDWRASMRHGRGGDLLVREFAAEEQFTLAVSVDTRPGMFLPEAMPKAETALWLAEALARLALANDDKVLLHRLFGKGGGFTSLAGSSAAHRLPQLFRQVHEPVQDHDIHLAPLIAGLPPAAVWIVISDFYFQQDKDMRAFIQQALRFREGMRWLILVDLDSWPYESAALGMGSRRLPDPGALTEDKLCEIGAQQLEQVARRIHDHKLRFRKQLQGDGIDWIHWSWPLQADPIHFFKSSFADDPVLKRLFMKGVA